MMIGAETFCKVEVEAIVGKLPGVGENEGSRADAAPGTCRPAVGTRPWVGRLFMLTVAF